MEFINNYIFFIIFLTITFLFLILSIFFKIKIIKLISILLFSIFFVLSFFELFLSFHMSPTKLLTYNKILFDTQIEKDTKKLKVEHYIELEKNKQRVLLKNEEIDEKHNFSNEDMVYDVKYTLYKNNIRYTKSNKDSNDIYIFLGCSFVFGEGVNDTETLPYFFSEKFNFSKNILNFGICGKSTNTALSLFEKNIIDQFLSNKKNVLHFFYIVFADYFRNFRIEATNTTCDNWLYLNNKWQRTKQPLESIKIIFSKSYIFMAIFQILIEQYYIPVYKQYFIDSLYKIERIVKEKYNANFTIIIYPDHMFNFNELKNTRLNTIVLKDKFNNFGTYRIERNGHPTAKANKEIANILFDYINKKIF